MILCIAFFSYDTMVYWCCVVVDVVSVRLKCRMLLLRLGAN